MGGTGTVTQGQQQQGQPQQQQPKHGRGEFFLLLVLLSMVVCGAANFALYKSMFNAFGPANAYFVSQGVNLLYCVYGGVILAYKTHCTPDITPAMRKVPQRKFALMGLLDSLGTFLTAMGAVFTPGVFQTLLNQSLIPATMLASRPI